MSQYEKTKLTKLTQPGEYTVKICKIQDKDVGLTKAGAPKVRILMTTQDGLAINDSFYASTPGAMKRAAAFVATATGKKLPMPTQDADQFRSYIEQACHRFITITVVEEMETWTDGSQRMVTKVSRFKALQQQPVWNTQPPKAPAPAPIEPPKEQRKGQWFDYDGPGEQEAPPF